MPPRKRTASTSKPEPGATPEPPVEDENLEQPDPASPDAATPERSDLQTADTPCAECFPQGWPDQSFAVGCEHGTWTRD